MKRIILILSKLLPQWETLSQHTSWSLCISLLLSATACSSGSTSGGTKSGNDSAAIATPSHHLTMPVPPMTLATDSDRLAYVAARYWQSMDLRDTTWIADTTALEQGYANYLGLLTQLPADKAAQYITAFYRTTEACPPMSKRIFAVAERYLYDPNSPLRNEELYIPVLRWAVSSPTFDEYEKIRPQFQLDLALKNRPGAVATDFPYSTATGEKSRLHALKAQHTLLFFYNPDCHDCARVKDYIASSPVFSFLLSSGTLRILAIYTDNDLALWRERLPQMPPAWTVGYNTDLNASETYDLRAIPCLYLLDAQKRVLLKDATVEGVEGWLKGNS